MRWKSTRLMFAATLLAVSTVTTACGPQKPYAQGAFINTSDKEMSISFIATDHADKTYILKTVAPHSVGFHPLPLTKFDVAGLDADNNAQWLIESYQPRAGKPGQYLVFDLAGEYDYTMANAKFLYEAGNSFAAELQKNSGGSTLINGRYSGDKPFVLSFEPAWPYQRLPSKISATSELWALVPIPKADTDDAQLAVVIEAYLRGLDVER